MYTLTEKELKNKRIQMVNEQIMAKGILNEPILAAMREIPRHVFLPPEFWGEAYEDRPIPIENNQTLSQPYMVASATEYLDLAPTMKVLEVGSGSGYQAAVLSKLAKQVVGIEFHPVLAAASKERIQKLELKNVVILQGDGKKGCTDFMPYDRILVSCAVSSVPEAWLQQLKDEGILVFPEVLNAEAQVLARWRKRGNQWVDKERLFGVKYVPLL